MTRPVDALAVRRLIANLEHLLRGCDDDHLAACAVQSALVGHMLANATGPFAVRGEISPRTERGAG